MRRFKLAGKLLHDIEGSVLVETTVLFPLFLLLVLGTIDAGYMIYDWVVASKADYLGARTAAVIDPVATGINNPPYNSTVLGNFCFYVSGPLSGTPTGDCPTVTPTVCTDPTSGGICTNGYTFDNTAFMYIYSRMHGIFPRLQPQNIVISYTPYTSPELGFVGQPGGLPMNVTVTLQCVTHEFYFLSGLMGWLYTTPLDASGNSCPASTPKGPLIPSFVTTTTLPSEDLATN